MVIKGFMYVTNSCNWEFGIKALLNRVELVPLKQKDADPSIVTVTCVLLKVHYQAQYCIISGLCPATYRSSSSLSILEKCN